MLNTIVAVALLLSFAVLVVVHLVLVALLVPALGARSLLALILPPLAPYWGLEERKKRLSAAWVAAFALYAAALLTGYLIAL